MTKIAENVMLVVFFCIVFMLLHQVVSRSQLTSGPVSSSKACTWPCQAEESGDLQAVWAHTEGQVLAETSRKFPEIYKTRNSSGSVEG
jgi:hypothetical protein